jgi:hypothetical protein
MAITIGLEKSKRPVAYLKLLGYFFILCALAMIIATIVDAYKEYKHAKWPRVSATITKQTVRHFMNGRHEAWRIESEVHYPVEGLEITANVSSGIGNVLDEKTIRRWTTQHPPGTSLIVRYDPEHHDSVVPDAAENMPESGPQAPDDLKGIILSLVLSGACMTVGWLLERRLPKPTQTNAADGS